MAIRSDGMDPSGREEGRSPSHPAGTAGGELFAGRLWMGLLLGTAGGGGGGALRGGTGIMPDGHYSEKREREKRKKENGR
jgi:hypothetical protein